METIIKRTNAYWKWHFTVLLKAFQIPKFFMLFCSSPSKSSGGHSHSSGADEIPAVTKKWELVLQFCSHLEVSKDEEILDDIRVAVIMADFGSGERSLT